MKFATLVLLPALVPITTSGVPGRDGWTMSTEAISSSSECSEDDADSEERLPTRTNSDLLCERTRLT